jgi:hypothetical protein
MDNSRYEYAGLLLAETREDLGRADTKVSVLLSTAGIIASIVTGAIAAGHWRPTQLALWAQVIWWCGVGVASVGIVALASAIAPRIRHPEDKSALRYFAHAAQFESLEDLMDALKAVDDQTGSLTGSQLWLLSKILVRKYVLIRFALISFGAAALMLIAAAAGG